MKRHAFVLTTAIVLGVSCIANAKPSMLSQKDTDNTVIKLQTAYADTFDRRDANGMAALFSENSTMQNEWGDVTQGRAKIKASVEGLMAKLPPGVKLRDTALVSQSISPDVIVSQGVSLRMTPDKEPQKMFFTRVLVRKGTTWLIAATQIARPSTVPKPTP